MCEPDGSLNRREFLGTAAAATGAAAAAGAGLEPAIAEARRRRRRRSLGYGGKPTDLPTLARLARERGRGSPLCFLDLAAVDRNMSVVVDFALPNKFAIRPALKAFQSPDFSAYVMRRLPEPRGLAFDIRSAELIFPKAPRGTDLLLGYAPTLGELERYLLGPRKKRKRGQRLRLLIDSVPLLEHLARLARQTKRRLPLDVALEFDSGLGRGGVDSEGELDAMMKILRAEKARLNLGAVLCYDGHATLNGDQAYRQLVAKSAQQRYRRFLDHLAEHGADLFDPKTLIRNGPASSNYRNWAGTDEANEISPGSAFVFAGYLQDFDHAGLAPAVTQASPLMRITGNHPSVPLTQTPVPGATQEEVIIRAGPWPGSSMVHPGGLRQDELSGGGFALVAPKGALELGDYVLMRPSQTEQGIEIFAALTLVREGRVLGRWATLPRWSNRVKTT